jgi:signal transduction histidine kinase/ActR/RegA family two-component response regulator
MTVEANPEAELRVLILPPTRRDGEVTCGVLQRAGIPCAVCGDPIALASHISAGLGAIIITDALAVDPRVSHITGALNAQPAWSDIPAILLSRPARPAGTSTRLIAGLTNVTILDRPTSIRTLLSSVRTAIRGRRRQYQLRDQLSALRAAEEALRNADRRKDEFLAMLAHELRNPLAPIRTASELLARTLPPQTPAQSAVNIVKRQVTHLTRLVDDLLDVSRITQGRIELHRRPLELAGIIAQAMESVGPLVSEKRHGVTLAAASDPLYVEADSARLVQCVTNLLTNAVKYTDNGGEIKVETRAVHPNAVISVSDNGIGIPADLLPRIFGLFVQNARSLDRSEGGLGIGLSIVEKIVKMHGGTVTASSAGPGRGATFEISLPLVDAPKRSSHEPAQPQVFAKRILLVDDNVDAAISLAEILQLDGHEVRAVHSAKSALETMQSFLPDVVLLDIGLPDMDGYQVAQRIRDAGKLVRIIALTGYGQSADHQDSRAAGFDAHLTKPVKLDVLEQVIAGNVAEESVPN